MRHTSIVPDETKLAPLRVPIPPDAVRHSGFRHVHYVETDLYGRDLWHAKVKVNGRLVFVPGSRSYHPHVSALAVADWYEQRFGKWWPLYLHRTGAKPVRAWKSRKHRGWVAQVWIVGAPEPVVRFRCVKGVVVYGGEWRVFGSRAEAMRGAREYLVRRCGYLIDLLAFRVADGR